MRQSRHLGLGGLHKYDTGWINMDLGQTYRISGSRYLGINSPDGEGTIVSKGGEMMVGGDGNIDHTGLFGIGDEITKEEDGTEHHADVGNVTAVPIIVPIFNGKIIGVDFRFLQSELNTGSFNYCWGLSTCEVKYPSLSHTYVNRYNLRKGVIGITQAQEVDNELFACGTFTLTDDRNEWWATSKKENTDNLLTTTGINNFIPVKRKNIRNINNYNYAIVYLYLWTNKNQTGNVHLSRYDYNPAVSIKIYYSAYHKIQGWRPYLTE